MTLHSLLQIWREFFFHQESALPLAVFRIGFGLVSLVNALLIAGDFDLLYGESGLVPREDFERNLKLGFVAALARSVNYKWVLGIQIFASIGLTIGAGGQVAAAILFGSSVLWRLRNPMAAGGPEQFLRVFSFLLIWTPCDAALSVFKPQGDTFVSAWSIQLLRLQFSLVLIQTVIWKIRSPVWRSGAAVWRVFQESNFRTVVPFPFSSPEVYKLANYSVLTIQAIAPFTIWIEELRWPSLAAIALVHLGLWVYLRVGLYQPLMLSALILFGGI